jgi:hypothetical protein
MPNSNNPANNNGTLRICDNLSDIECEELYQYIRNRMLMDTPEEYLINNIERVCGSREFAEIMVRSYLNKNGFIYPIDDISGIILWKKSSKETNYKTFFMEHYSNCYLFIDSVVYLNFEGINKFLLNINVDDVENFEVKEQINQMYYNSMTELIHSFETLYKHK